MAARREISGKAAGFMLLVVAVVLAAVVVMVVRANHANAVRNQEIANCTWILHYSWAHCAKLYP